MTVAKFSTDLRNCIRNELLRDPQAVSDSRTFERAFNDTWHLYAEPRLEAFIRSQRLEEGDIQALRHTTMDEFRGMT